MQTTQRYVYLFYIVAGLVVWATFAKLFSGLAFMMELPDPEVLGRDFTASNVLGFFVALGIGLYAIKSERVSTFANDVVDELRKVTWPDKKDTNVATRVVIITTLIISGVLWLFDLVWSNLTGFVYS